MFADEPIGGPAEGEGKAEQVVAQPASRRVENICEHYVHGVLSSDWAGAQHGEAELHGENKVRGEQEESVVDGVWGGGELVGDGCEAAAYEGGGGGGVGGASEEGEEVSGRAAGQGISHGCFGNVWMGFVQMNTWDWIL